MRNLYGVISCCVLLSLAVVLDNAYAKKPPKTAEVSAIYLDVLKIRACAAGQGCSTVGGPKQINLLEMAEGKTDFAKQVLLPARTHELRLLLGKNSTIAVDGQAYPLAVPSGQSSGLKLKGQKVFGKTGGFLTDITLGFNLAKGLVVKAKKGKGKNSPDTMVYSLKPVIQVSSAEVMPMPENMAAVVALPGEENKITLGDKFSLFIPAGAVSVPMVISVKETKYTVEVMDEETGEVVNKPALSSSYELSPDGAEFAMPLEIAIPYYTDMLSSDVSEYDLAVYLDGEKIPTAIDAASKIAAADVWHFSVAKLSDGSIAFETQMPVDNFEPNNFGWKFLTFEEPPYIYHPGTDLNATNDDSGNIPVHAISDGTVVADSDNWGGIVIKHSLDGHTYYSQYGHILHLKDNDGKKIKLNTGDSVKIGDAIGYIGNVSTRPMKNHLHFEIRRSDSFHPDPTNADFWTNSEGGDILKTRKEVFKAYESPLAFVRSYENPYQTVIIVEDSVTYPGISNDIQDNKVIDPSLLPVAAATLDPDAAVIKQRFFKPYPDNVPDVPDPDKKNLEEWSVGDLGFGEINGFGGNYHYATTVSGNITTHAGTWYFDIPTDGLYKVYASIPALIATSEKARYRIYHNKKYDQVIINQAAFKDKKTLDERWATLGIFDFAKGNDHYVKLLNSTGEADKKVGFDAIKLVKVSDIAVSSVSPETATVGQATIFTISGPRLSSNLEFQLDDCANIEPLGGTSISMQFRCTPSSEGMKSGTVKIGPLGITLSEFTVNIVADNPPPAVTSVSPAAATLGVATDFTVMGKNMPSTLVFQLEDCTGVEQLDSNISSTYKQFRCTPTSTGENKNGELRDTSNGTVLKEFPVDFIAAPPPSDGEIILAGVRVFDKIAGQVLHENGQAEYIAKACLFKHSDIDNPDTPLIDETTTYTKEKCFEDQRNTIADVTEKGTWLVTPGMYADSIGGGLVQAEPGSAGHTVNVFCKYYHSPSNRELSGTWPVTIK